MFILVVLLLSLVVAFIRGGRLSALGNLRFHHLWIFFVPFTLQLMAFSPFADAPAFGGSLARTLYLVSMLVAAIALWLNRRLPGLVFIALGLSLNLLVITLNNGFMPVSMAAREFAGMPTISGRTMNVVPMNAATVLPWLGDILPLPAWIPLANVFSIGDVLITIGGVLFIQRALAPPHSHLDSRTRS